MSNEPTHVPEARSIQTFQITRAPEEAPLSPGEIRHMLWASRPGSEWAVDEVIPAANTRRDTPADYDGADDPQPGELARLRAEITAKDAARLAKLIDIESALDARNPDCVATLAATVMRNWSPEQQASLAKRLWPGEWDAINDRPVNAETPPDYSGYPVDVVELRKGGA